jgi:hypothetical protein
VCPGASQHRPMPRSSGLLPLYLLLLLLLLPPQVLRSQQTPPVSANEVDDPPLLRALGLALKKVPVYLRLEPVLEAWERVEVEV